MPLFKYEVVDNKRKTLTGVMDSQNESEVRQRLIERGYIVNAVTELIPPGTARQAPSPARIPAVQYSGCTSSLTPPVNELIVFFRSMQSFLHSGIGMHNALVRMGGETPNRTMRAICERMASTIESGGKLSEAMSEFPKAFPSHIVAVVSAGELGGFLPSMFNDIALDYEIENRASIRWVRWATKLLWVHFFLILIILPFPAFIFTEGVVGIEEWLSKAIPFTTKFVVIPMVLAISVYHVLKFILSLHSMRFTAGRLILSLPWFGRASKERALAVFTRILWRLQNSGILPIAAWSAASQVAQNPVIAQCLEDQLVNIRKGAKLSEALNATEMFSIDDIRIVSAAETSGQTPDSLRRVASYYEDAAMVSVGKIRYINFRFAIAFNTIGIGALVIVLANMLRQQFNWVDWFMSQPGVI